MIEIGVIACKDWDPKKCVRCGAYIGVSECFTPIKFETEEEALDFYESRIKEIKKWKMIEIREEIKKKYKKLILFLEGEIPKLEEKDVFWQQHFIDKLNNPDCFYCKFHATIKPSRHASIRRIFCNKHKKGIGGYFSLRIDPKIGLTLSKNVCKDYLDDDGYYDMLKYFREE